VFLARLYCAVMLSRLLTVTFDAHDAGRLAQFWADILGREVVEGTGGLLLPGSKRITRRGRTCGIGFFTRRQRDCQTSRSTRS
jgi:hypothetical protein